MIREIYSLPSVKSLGSSLVVLTPLFSLFFVVHPSSFFTPSTACLLTFQIPLHKGGNLLVVKLSKSKVFSDKRKRKKRTINIDWVIKSWKDFRISKNLEKPDRFFHPCFTLNWLEFYQRIKGTNITQIKAWNNYRTFICIEVCLIIFDNETNILNGSVKLWRKRK